MIIWVAPQILTVLITCTVSKAASAHITRFHHIQAEAQVSPTSVQVYYRYWSQSINSIWKFWPSYRVFSIGFHHSGPENKLAFTLYSSAGGIFLPICHQGLEKGFQRMVELVSLMLS